MPDFILLDGDTVNFMPNFGAAVVTVQPGNLKGSGPGTIGKTNICVDGDEKNVSVPGCQYIAGAFSTPGAGTLKIKALAGDQKAANTKTGGKQVLVKGGNFEAVFEVQTPAQQPSTPPVADTMKEYSGQGSFVNTNTTVKGG